MAYMINREAPQSGLANLLALKGRMGDTELVHMTKPEVAALQAMGQLTINPSTGLPEAFKLKDILPTLVATGANIMTGGALTPLQLAMTAGGTSLLANKGDLGKAAMDGLMAFGGAKLGQMLGGAQVPGKDVVAEEVAKQQASAAAVQGAPITASTIPVTPATTSQLTQTLTEPSLAAKGLSGLTGQAATITPAQQQLADLAAGKAVEKLGTQEALKVAGAQAALPLAGALSVSTKQPAIKKPTRLAVDQSRVEQKDYVGPKPLTQERIEEAFIADPDRPIDPLKFFQYSATPATFKTVPSFSAGSQIASQLPMENAADTNGSGMFSGMVEDSGRGDAMSDNVLFEIVGGGRNMPKRALLSPDEYVVDGYTVAALGNGSSDAGAKVLDEFREEIRKQAYGKKKQPNQINARKIAKKFTKKYA